MYPVEQERDKDVGDDEVLKELDNEIFGQELTSEKMASGNSSQKQAVSQLSEQQ